VSGPPPRLAVVVLAWNSRAEILDCLESLRLQVRSGDAVLVADNGSSDGTVEAVRRAHPWAEILENGSNLGYAAGNNAGIRRALDRGFDAVLLLNPDTVAEAGAVEALRAALAASPAAGALQPLLLLRSDPSRADSLGLRPRRTFGGVDAGRGGPAAAAPGGPEPIFGACGAAALYRSAALRAAGLLDEGLFLLEEDLDLAFRLRMAGFDALLVPSARVLHRRGVSGSPADPAAARRRKQWLQRNTVALALRYWPAGRLLLGSPLLAWRMATALGLSRSNPGHPCLPLWSRFLGLRSASRRAMAERGLDRWFA
jgi:GT2 family glycosyltransferase